MAVTGRPAGWCDHIARMWPVDAVVGENGGFYFRYDHERRRMHRRYRLSEAQRLGNRRRLEALCRQIVDAVPGAAPAADQPYRECDLAIDYREDVPPLGQEQVARICGLFATSGANSKVSSIHVNGWFGDYDKLETARLALKESFGIDADTQRASFLFVGDSPNDAPLFGFFPVSVGVANVRAFEGNLATWPAYVTEQESGAGFAELVDWLLAA
jgi:hypothetical protein